MIKQLAKPTLNSIESLISKALIDSYIRQNELVLVSNVQKIYLQHLHRLQQFIKDFNLFINYIEKKKHKKNTESKNQKVAKAKNKTKIYFIKMLFVWFKIV